MSFFKMWEILLKPLTLFGMPFKVLHYCEPCIHWAVRVVKTCSMYRGSWQQGSQKSSCTGTEKGIGITSSELNVKLFPQIKWRISITRPFVADLKTTFHGMYYH